MCSNGEMQLFECQRCGQLLEFENTRCERCGLRLGYLPALGVLSALEEAAPGLWRPLAAPDRLQRACANNAHAVCNWLVPAADGALFCEACRLNRTIPNLSNPAHVLMWQRLEFAKHRLIYELMRLGLPLHAKSDQPEVGLAFDFLAPDEADQSAPVTTGHDRGLITLNITEADDVERERYRANLAEPYRTILGHLRHEIGHYYWERLIQDRKWQSRFRELFGDERESYEERLKRHYENGPPADWAERYITSYASMHPWEDWAETWAHYLHMVSTLETAYSFGMSVAPRAGRDPSLAMMVNLDPFGPITLELLMSRWLPVVYVGNSLNRSMGQPDLYPFVINASVMEKLRFVHEVARSRADTLPDQTVS